MFFKKQLAEVCGILFQEEINVPEQGTIWRRKFEQA